MYLGILSFYSGHIGFADNLVAIWNVLGVDLEAISHIEIALPEASDYSQRLERFNAMVTDNLADGTGFKLVNPPSISSPLFVLVRVP